MQFPNYLFPETLRDGTAVTVRAATANDGAKIRRAFLNLERDTVYTRFFGYKAGSKFYASKRRPWLCSKSETCRAPNIAE